MMKKTGAAHMCGPGRLSVFARQKEGGDAAVGLGDYPERVFTKAFARFDGVDGVG